MGETHRKNVFVVGAGASTDFGLPVGSGLKSTIANNCAFDMNEYDGVSGGSKLLERALNAYSFKRGGKGSPTPLYLKAGLLANAMSLAPSIDNYLSINSNDDELLKIGKMAIAEAIALSERASSLWKEPGDPTQRLDFSKLEQSWLSGVANLLLARGSFDEFIESLRNITFVTFNYDRCIEQYFRCLGDVYFPQISGASFEIYDALNVIHVYGSLGELFRDGTKTHLGYGELHEHTALIDISEEIKVFPEGAAVESLEEKLEELLGNCEVLIFLGFAFHPMNINLFPKKKIEGLQRLIVTNRGFSADDIKMLQVGLLERFGVKPSFGAKNASDVFSAYRQFFLSAAT